MAPPRSRFGKFFGGAASTAGGYAAGAATADTLRPILQELVNAANAAHPVRPVSAEQAAQATFTGGYTLPAGRGEAAKSGYGTGAFNALRSMVGNTPGISQLLDLWRRGRINEGEFEDGLRLAAMRPEWIEAVKALRAVLLTPEQAAAAVERGELTYEQAEDIAALSGTGAEAFRVIERLAGLAPSTEQLISLRRRGAIDEARMRKGFIQGNVRSEWADALAKLADVLLSPAELANMVVEGILPEADAATLAQIVGVNPDNFARLVRLAGNPPGATQLLDLWRRGELDEGDVDRGLRQSRLKPEWVAAIKKLREHLPTVSDVIRFAVKDVFDPRVVNEFGLDDEFPTGVLPLAAQQGIGEEQMRWQWRAHWRNVSPTALYRMVWRGVITEAQMNTALKVADYAPFWRPKLAAIAHLVPGRIDLRRFLAEGIIDRAEVKRGYVRLGYTEQVAEWQTQLAEKLAGATEGGGDFVQRAQTQLWTTTHRSFLAGESTATQAKTKLGQAGVPPAERDAVVAVWTNERELVRKQLTAAQVKKAYAQPIKNQTTGLPWTREDAITALVERGYSVNDANEFLDI